jgi:biotin carboxylase
VIDLADHLLLTDYTDIGLSADLLRPFLERYTVVGVLSLTESGLLASARLNALLGFADNAVEVVERVVDKAQMRAWLASDSRYRLPAVVVTTPADLHDFVKEIGFPVILKPINGTGSADVVFLDSQDNLNRWLSSLPRLPMLAEQFAVGDEYSVEAYSRDGAHSIAAVTKKLLYRHSAANPFVELGHCVPAPLDDARRLALEQYVRDFLSLIGIRWGLSHTEIIASKTGFVIIETHPRNGGDRIVDLVRQATGIDLLDTAIAIRSGLSHKSEPLSRPQAAAMRFFIVEPGVIQAIDGVHTARTAPGVIDIEIQASPGDRITAVNSSNDRPGLVVAIGSSAEEATRRTEKAVSMIRFVMRAEGLPSPGLTDAANRAAPKSA